MNNKIIIKKERENGGKITKNRRKRQKEAVEIFFIVVEESDFLSPLEESWGFCLFVRFLKYELVRIVKVVSFGQLAQWRVASGSSKILSQGAKIELGINYCLYVHCAGSQGLDS
jgi:hypothetical protein